MYGSNHLIPGCESTVSHHFLVFFLSEPHIKAEGLHPKGGAGAKTVLAFVMRVKITKLL